MSTDSNTPSEAPEGWLEAIARADADHAAGRFVDSGELRRRAEAALT